MASNLTALPDRFNAGTTVKYTRTLGDYPASQGWSLALYLAGAASFSVAGSPNANAFDVTITAAKTATVTIASLTVTAAGVVTRAAGDFTADGVLTGYLVSGPGIPSGAYVKSVDSATQLTLSEPCTAGAALSLKFRFPDGVYRWRERVSKAGEVFDADEGTLNVDPDIANAPAGALQPKEEIWLALVDDVIEGRISGDAAAYQIGDRAKTFVNMRDWITFRGQLKATIAARSNPGTLTMVRAAFTGAGAER